MPPTAVETFEAEIAACRARIREHDQAAAAGRDAAETLVADIRASGVDPLADGDAFNRIDEAYRVADGAAEAAAEARRRLDRLYEMAGRSQPEPAPGRTAELRSNTAWAQRFVDAEAYRLLASSGVLDTTGARVETAPVEVATREEALRTLFLAAADNHSPLVPEDQQLLPPVPLPARTLRVIDLITTGTTNRELVEYTVQVTRKEAVAGVAYGVASPQSNYLWERRTAGVKRRAHHAVATKGNLADQGELRSLIDSDLLAGSRRELEAQVLNGDAVGENFRGILNTAGIGAVARNVAGGENRHDAIHRGITAVRLALEDDITAVGIHPTPFEQIVLAKEANGAYLHGPPAATSPRTIWGYPAVVSTVFPAGTAVPANWPVGAKLWMRTGVAVNASDAPGNFFLEGLVAVQAELRAAFAAVQPKAFAAVTGL
jgi:HK97 family phage major capsid protein